MPRNTCNFWIDADIDGRSSTLSGGPVSKDGCINVTIYIRDNGTVLRALEIRGRATRNGELKLTAQVIADGYHDGAELTLSDGREIEIATKR